MRTKFRHCPFCKRGIDHIDFLEVATYQKHLTNWGKIKPNYEIGACPRHQRQLSHAVKNARFMALLPYVSR